MLKFSKKFLSIIMAILMLSMTAIGVNAEELITGIDDLLIDIGIIDPSPEEELMPMSGNSCGYGNITSWENIDHETKADILSSLTNEYKSKVGNNPDIYYDTDGTIVLCGTGSFKGKTYRTDLNREDFM